MLFGLGRSTALTLTGAGLSGAAAACFVVVVPSVVFAHHPTTPTHATSTRCWSRVRPDRSFACACATRHMAT